MLYGFQNLLNDTALFNKQMSQPALADVFTLLLELGLQFCEFSGSTDLAYSKGSATQQPSLRMTLALNPGGYNRLRISYVAKDVVNMEFYLFEKLPNGRKLKTNLRLVENVNFAQTLLIDVFEEVTGLHMPKADDSAPAPAASTEYDDDPF